MKRKKASVPTLDKFNAVKTMRFRMGGGGGFDTGNFML